MGKRILVVDDSASVRQVVGIALKNAGYEVIEASDGNAALAKLDGTKVNLIISDVNMPGMDGIALLENVKQNPSYRFTPVLMLTTEAGADMKERGKAAGAKAWLVKPFQPEILLKAVARLT